jgi:endonuclease/exonuclease/phosphatase family metal-dependent hydrolase
MEKAASLRFGSGIAGLLGVTLLGAASGGCDLIGKKDPEGPGIPVTVLTRNLYLGTDLTPLSDVTSPSEVPVVGAQLWAEIQASDFPSRAKVLADQIIALAPDLVALQEVSLYRQQIPSDTATGNLTPNAEDVVLDFLASLMAELDARGGGYTVAGVATNADAELPVAGATGLFDLRVTDRDVILTRGGVETSNFVQVTFDAALPLSVGGVPVTFTRSFSHLDATVGEGHFTFGNTHLEIQRALPIQLSQATQLVSGYGRISGPLLLSGDYNSSPTKPTYDNILDPAFVDPQPIVAPGDPGLTCCQAADLKNPTSVADERIDHTFYRGSFRPLSVEVVGSDPDNDRTPSGLWASDHFGVLTKVELVP